MEVMELDLEWQLYPGVVGSRKFRKVRECIPTGRVFLTTIDVSHDVTHKHALISGSRASDPVMFDVIPLPIH